MSKRGAKRLIARRCTYYRLEYANAAARAEKIHFMLAHRPGFPGPTLAARQIASLDQFSAGRLGVHFISGG